MNATRVMIIGGTGAGKSWLALRLSKLLGLAVYCVDDAVHDEDGKLRTNADIDRTVQSWASKDQWIIEGGNSRTYLDRVSRATVLVLMKPPRWLRVYRVAVRNKLNFSMVYWSWKYDEVFGIKDEKVVEAAGPGVAKYIVKNNKDAHELLALLTPERCSRRCD
ncbi:P-loop NTPase family protein [Marinobacter nitratireducens]|uniref:hypothetical protein n=1 Tax=Marinobacter nitratireducens TaxID=1137280 RepID=UPI000689B5EA|nr:hypothetical protein [Marinobacter nitratireducens]